MPQFTQQQSQEMYDILAEIHESLTDKRMYKGSLLRLSQYEIGWLLGIGKLLKKIHKQ